MVFSRSKIFASYLSKYHEIEYEIGNIHNKILRLLKRNGRLIIFSLRYKFDKHKNNTSKINT